MTKRQIYLRAAELIAEGSRFGCCHTINKAAKIRTVGGYCRASREFQEIFQPRGREWRGFSSAFWMRRENEIPGCEAVTHRRIVALCFMAAMSSHR